MFLIVEEDDQPYDPTPLTIRTGETVRWNNTGFEKDENIRTIFDSCEMKPGNTFTHQFNQLGTYDYFCTIHPVMTGVIVLK